MSDPSSTPPIPPGEPPETYRVAGRRLHGSAAFARSPSRAYGPEPPESVRIVSSDRAGNGQLVGELDPEEPRETGAGEQEGEATKGKRALRTVVEWVAVIGGALLVALVVKTFLVQAFWIPSPSMRETLVEGDRVLVNKLADDIDDINRGDIVVFKRPEDGNGGHPESEIQDLIKRVVGLPGDEIEARDGAVYVNDQRLDEPYVSNRPTQRLDPMTVPEDHMFVMGDNRTNSHDSRFFGPVPDENIVGRAFLRVWPLSSLGGL